MAETSYTRDAGHVNPPGDHPEAAYDGHGHDYFGGPSETKFSGQSRSGSSESDNYASTGYPPDLTLPEADAGGQVPR